MHYTSHVIPMILVGISIGLYFWWKHRDFLSGDREWWLMGALSVALGLVTLVIASQIVDKPTPSPDSPDFVNWAFLTLLFQFSLVGGVALCTAIIATPIYNFYKTPTVLPQSPESPPEEKKEEPPSLDERIDALIKQSKR